MEGIFKKILGYAKEKGYQENYSSTFLLIGLIVFSALSILPPPFGIIISLLSSAFFIPPFKALNYAKLHSTEFNVFEQSSFNGRQVGLIIAGGILWGFIIIGFAIKDT